jgi:exopolyphosphatase / guanosine-5'-triphosphate,3'-diphosphate pyrophosphatase
MSSATALTDPALASIANPHLLRLVRSQRAIRTSSLPISSGQAQKIGIIDVGSNTSRLIVLAYTAGVSFRLVDQTREQVRLSEGMGAENLLRLGPIQRTVQLLRVFRGLCEGNGIDTIVTVGTSAVREARNQTEFLRHVREQAGLDLRILSGEEEARYDYLAAANSLAFTRGAVLDICGGSLELVRVKDGRLCRTAVLPAGAVRLTEQFLRSDPPRPAELRALRRHLELLLHRADWITAGRGDRLVGMGGTIRTLAKIDQRLRNYPLDRVHGYLLSRKRIEAILGKLAAQPLRKRRKFPGLSSERADVTVAATVALLAVMEHAGYEEVAVCGQGLREGIFYEHFLRKSGADTVADVRAFGLANLSLLYDLNWAHARHVERLAVSLFDQLRPLHGYGAPERTLLSAAALLHDVGLAIDYYQHHKYSASIILDADLPGFSHREVALISQLALYHRRGIPKRRPFPGVLKQADGDRIARLGALLRLAEYLERSRTQIIRAVRCTIQRRAVRVECRVEGDASTELWATERKSDLFEHAFTRRLILHARQASGARPAAPSPANGSGALWRRMDEVMALLGQG